MKPTALPETSPHGVAKRASRRAAPAVNVMLADDQPQVRSALRLLLELAQPRWIVVAEAEDAGALDTDLARTSPDIVLLDWELPGLTDAMKRSLMGNPGRRHAIVVLSGRPEVRRAALDAGADEFVSKADHPEELLAALQRSLTVRPAQRQRQRRRA